MKNLLKTTWPVFLLFAIILSSVRLQAQIPNNEQNQLFARNHNDTVSAIKQMKDFNVNFHEDIVYVKLVMKGLNSNCFFELQRSTDGVNYQSVDNIKGVPVPSSSLEILYCMKDTDPLENVSYYRVKQILQSDEKYTNPVIIYKKPEIEVAQKTTDPLEKK
jgi:hypothetical protein